MKFTIHHPKTLFIITNVMIYWLTNTAASAARFYYEDAHAEVPEGPTTVPLGLANFAGDFQSFKSFAKRDHKNIVSWNVYDEWGHFPTEMTPDLYVEYLKQFADNVSSD